MIGFEKIVSNWFNNLSREDISRGGYTLRENMETLPSCLQEVITDLYHLESGEIVLETGSPEMRVWMGGFRKTFPESLSLLCSDFTFTTRNEKSGNTTFVWMK